jgi:hypothetical protein
MKTHDWHTDRLRWDTTFSRYAASAERVGETVVSSGTDIEVRATGDPRRVVARLPGRSNVCALVGASGLMSHHPEDRYVRLGKERAT